MRSARSRQQTGKNSNKPPEKPPRSRLINFNLMHIYAARRITNELPAWDYLNGCFFIFSAGSIPARWKHLGGESYCAWQNSSPYTHCIRIQKKETIAWYQKSRYNTSERVSDSLHQLSWMFVTQHRNVLTIRDQRPMKLSLPEAPNSKNNR